MAAANTDKFRKKKNLFSTNLDGSITDSDTTLSCDSLAGVPTDTAVTITIDRVDINGTSTPSAREDITGVVSGNNLTNLLRGEGATTAQAHSDNAVVEITWESESWNDAIDGFLAEHGQDGTHSTDAIDAITEIASALKSGSDATLITGTAGTTNFVAKWNADGDLVDGYEVKDEDNMASDSATALATQQSIKAYVDANGGGDVVDDTTPQLGGDLDVNGNNITNSSADHIAITAGTNKLVKMSMLRQDNTSNTYSNNQVILTGWGAIAGAASNALNESVSFGVTFSSAPIVLISAAGTDTTPSATAIGDFTAAQAHMMVTVNISTTGFTAYSFKDNGGNHTVGRDYGYTWIAIGTLS